MANKETLDQIEVTVEAISSTMAKHNPPTSVGIAALVEVLIVASIMAGVSEVKMHEAINTAWTLLYKPVKEFRHDLS